MGFVDQAFKKEKDLFTRSEKREHLRWVILLIVIGVFVAAPMFVIGSGVLSDLSAIKGELSYLSGHADSQDKQIASFTALLEDLNQQTSQEIKKLREQIESLTQNSQKNIQTAKATFEQMNSDMESLRSRVGTTEMRHQALFDLQQKSAQAATEAITGLQKQLNAEVFPVEMQR